MKEYFKNKLRIFGFVLVLMGILLMPMDFSRATTASDLQNQINQLNSQSAAAKAAAAQKAAQAAQIKNQITIVDNNIDETEQAIESTESQIATTNANIEELKKQIAVEENDYNLTRDQLGELITTWYMDKPAGLVETLVGSDNLSEIVTRQQYYESIRTQISGQMEKIQSLKVNLQTQQDQQNSQLLTLQGLQDDQQSRQSDLESQKNYKAQLLSNTQQAVNLLNQQVAETQKKVASLIAQYNAIYNSGSGHSWGSDLVSISPKGSDYYNQNNYPNVYLSSNQSRCTASICLTVKQAGCFITSIAMIATYYGKGLTPVDIVNKSNFSDGYWSPRDNIGITGMTTSYPTNWTTINAELTAGRPVIAGVVIPSCSGCYRNKDGANHYIVIRGFANGKYQINDPYWTNSSYGVGQVVSFRKIQKL
jgi:peptidoglycan hydrolase CwlO-like protein